MTLLDAVLNDVRAAVPGTSYEEADEAARAALREVASWIEEREGGICGNLIGPNDEECTKPDNHRDVGSCGIGTAEILRTEALR